MVHDMIVVEKMGKPGVAIVSGRFESDAVASSRAFGMPDLQWVVVPHIYRNLDPETCRTQTEDAIEDIVGSLTSSIEAREQAEATDTRRYEGEDRHDSILKMNQEFINEDLGDGLFLHPATVEAVEEMLTGTNLPPDHVVCDMPPGFGVATVEKIAINSVMAGAKPEHLPVVIAAVKALSKLGGQGGKSLLMSTSPQAPLLIVNGPVTKNLGLNPGSALGPGRDNQVNTLIGRAFALCFRNIGHWYLNKMDMDTIGTSRKFIQCIAENEDASPWDGFHVDQGFKANESTVSVFVTDGELDVQDQGNHTAEGLLKNLAYGSTFGTMSLQSPRSGQERLILMPPDVARPVGSQGFTKQAAREFIHKHARGSVGKLMQYMPLEGEARVHDHWKWLENLSEEQLLEITVPIMNDADDCYILVVGADRAKTAVFPSGPAPVTEGIDQYMA
ncbi:MAG: hypothetical protein HOJ22_03315 [Chloroflexi bacterium]|jgi:hypothetical protein|nr:hypothetical protein [Chloroflexota bacterium]MBT5627297.1 hypothetical protein [Chloroflexota bacterium]